MAGVATDEAPEEFKKLCAFRELFSGRFTEGEAATILAICDNDVKEAVGYVLTSAPEDVRERVQNEAGQWQTVERRIRHVKTERPVLDRARIGRVDTDCRMFSCQQCDIVWWRKTPSRKEVSKCHKCRRRYDPLPRDKEWGLAEFNCPNCNRMFTGYCAMWQTSPCFNCNNMYVRPTRILPPNKAKGGQRSRLKHRCNAPQCSGNRMGRPSANDRDSCVHPSSRAMRDLPKVVEASGLHDSTGSTVDTFLTQIDMDRGMTEFFPCLPRVSEVEED